MTTKNKTIFWIVGIVILLVAAGAAYYALRGPTQPTKYVDRGVEVTNIQTAEENPASVFRLDLRDRALQVATSSIPPERGTILEYVTTTSVPSSAIIPTSLFSSLGNLTLLNLDGDNLESIPPEIGDLKNLQVLYLTGNMLTSLPKEIGYLSNLWMLSLYNNQITTLPPTMPALKNLKVLGLSGNPIAQSSTAIAALHNELPNVQIITK
jgi:Leucine-rich repeat (LRR) protein